MLLALSEAASRLEVISLDKVPPESVITESVDKGKEQAAEGQAGAALHALWEEGDVEGFPTRQHSVRGGYWWVLGDTEGAGEY